MERHPGATDLMRFFAYHHLPEPLASISGQFNALARTLYEDERLDGPELTVALRKLLEAKDCAVRSALKEE